MWTHVIKGNRKRRRSPSPYGADRYEPRPRYADDYGTRLPTFLYPTPLIAAT